jgi:hypothetical protein
MPRNKKHYQDMKFKNEIIIKDDVFKTEVLFIFNCSQKEFQRRVKRYGIEETGIDNYTSGTVIHAKQRFFRIVWVKKFSKNYLSEFIHELFHLVVRICDDKGVPIKANIEMGECGDETAAYLMEFYVSKILGENRL